MRPGIEGERSSITLGIEIFLLFLLIIYLCQVRYISFDRFRKAEFSKVSPNSCMKNAICFNIGRSTVNLESALKRMEGFEFPMA